MTDKPYLLRVEDIDAFEGLHKTHFLNENAVRVNKSLGDMTGLTGLGFHLIEVEPGKDTTEFHMHHYEDEAVYILAGTATAKVGGDVYTVKAGDFLGYRKGGKAHSLTNTGDTVLRCIVVGERLSHDVGDYPSLKKRIYRNADMPWNLVDHDDIDEPRGGAKT